MVVTDMKADELLRDGDRVIGVRAGDDEVGAEVTIVAEGVLGLLSGGAGLREQPRRRRPRRRLQGDHRAAGRRDRGPLAPEPKARARPSSSWARSRAA